jgi:hypothetical protein
MFLALFHSGLSGGHMLHLLQQPIGEGTTGAEVGAPDRPGEPLLHADQSQVLALQEFQLLQRPRPIRFLPLL